MAPGGRTAAGHPLGPSPARPGRGPGAAQRRGTDDGATAPRPPSLGFPQKPVLSGSFARPNRRRRPPLRYGPSDDPPGQLRLRWFLWPKRVPSARLHRPGTALGVFGSGRQIEQCPVLVAVPAPGWDATVDSRYIGSAPPPPTTSEVERSHMVTTDEKTDQPKSNNRPVVRWQRIALTQLGIVNATVLSLAGDSVRLARAGRTTDGRRPQLRSVPGRDGVGRTRGERSPRRACRAAHRQSAIRASAPAVGSASHGAEHREVPRAVDGARLARAPLAGSASNGSGADH